MCHQDPKPSRSLFKKGNIMFLNNSLFLPAFSPTFVLNMAISSHETCPEGKSLEHTVFAWLNGYQAYRGQ